MPRFLENPSDFAAECARQKGRCAVLRENFLFLEDGSELAAVEALQRECERVVIIPDPSSEARAWLYHTSCRRMTDAVGQIFAADLGAPAPLPHAAPETTLGELHRRSLALSCTLCRARLDAFRLPEKQGQTTISVR
jgi:hypothetical protein